MVSTRADKLRTISLRNRKIDWKNVTIANLRMNSSSGNSTDSGFIIKVLHIRLRLNKRPDSKVTLKRLENENCLSKKTLDLLQIQNN